MGCHYNTQNSAGLTSYSTSLGTGTLVLGVASRREALSFKRARPWWGGGGRVGPPTRGVGLKNPWGVPGAPGARPARILGPLLRGIARALFSCPFLIDFLSISPPNLAPFWPPKSKKIDENSMSRCFPKLRSIFDRFLMDF